MRGRHDRIVVGFTIYLCNQFHHH